MSKCNAFYFSVLNSLFLFERRTSNKFNVPTQYVIININQTLHITIFETYDPNNVFKSQFHATKENVVIERKPHTIRCYYDMAGKHIKTTAKNQETGKYINLKRDLLPLHSQHINQETQYLRAKLEKNLSWLQKNADKQSDEINKLFLDYIKKKKSIEGDEEKIIKKIKILQENEKYFFIPNIYKLQIDTISNYLEALKQSKNTDAAAVKPKETIKQKPLKNNDGKNKKDSDSLLGKSILEENIKRLKVLMKLKPGNYKLIVEKYDLLEKLLRTLPENNYLQILEVIAERNKHNKLVFESLLHASKKNSLKGIKLLVPLLNKISPVESFMGNNQLPIKIFYRTCYIDAYIFASQANNKKILEFLIMNYDKKLNWLDPYVGLPALFYLYFMKDKTLLIDCLDKKIGDPDAKGLSGETLISEAANDGNFLLCKKLVNTCNVDVNTQEYSPILKDVISKLYPVKNKFIREVQTILIDEIKNKKLIGGTPLIFAIDREHFALVKFLINYSKANINLGDCHERTPLLALVIQYWRELKPNALLKKSVNKNSFFDNVQKNPSTNESKDNTRLNKIFDLIEDCLKKEASTSILFAKTSKGREYSMFEFLHTVDLLKDIVQLFKKYPKCHQHDNYFIKQSLSSIFGEKFHKKYFPNFNDVGDRWKIGKDKHGKKHATLNLLFTEDHKNFYQKNIFNHNFFAYSKTLTFTINRDNKYQLKLLNVEDFIEDKLKESANSKMIQYANLNGP